MSSVLPFLNFLLRHHHHHRHDAISFSAQQAALPEQHYYRFDLEHFILFHSIYHRLRPPSPKFKTFTNMHSSMLAPGLLALISASTVAAQTCGSNILPIGHECASGMRDGDRVCDPTCSDIVSPARYILCISPTSALTPRQLVCHDGKMQLNNACAPGHCVWREDAKSVFCSGVEVGAAAAAAHVAAIPDEDSEYPQECGFVQELGQKCSILIKEGAKLCDKACRNLVSLKSCF